MLNLELEKLDFYGILDVRSTRSRLNFFCRVSLFSFMICASTLHFPNFWGIIPHLFPSFPTSV